MCEMQIQLSECFGPWHAFCDFSLPCQQAVMTYNRLQWRKRYWTSL